MICERLLKLPSRQGAFYQYCFCCPLCRGQPRLLLEHDVWGVYSHFELTLWKENRRIDVFQRACGTFLGNIILLFFHLIILFDKPLWAKVLNTNLESDTYHACSLWKARGNLWVLLNFMVNGLKMNHVYLFEKRPTKRLLHPCSSIWVWVWL